VERLAARVKDGIAALLLESAEVLGPNPCTLARLRSRYRYDLLLRTLRAADMHQWMDHLQSTGAFRTKAESLVIDVDPVMLA
jgi:primosomal protein N' (replication factor Y)